jgi:hypothetical protein
MGDRVPDRPLAAKMNPSDGRDTGERSYLRP